MKPIIQKWKSKLELNEWNISTKEINPNSVAYPDDCPEEDRYFIGIMPNEDALHATIFHDRPLTEEDIVHELLHIKYPHWTENKVCIQTITLTNND